jgi:DNA adenine methylase Dam
MQPKPILTSTAPEAVIFFSGGGGIECGMVEAGIRPAIAVEFDPSNPKLSAKLADMHDRNFAEYGCKIIRKSIQEVVNLGFPGFSYEPKFWHFSPVCASFSKAGDGVEQQSDIDCAIAIAKTIKNFQPKIFTLEQVPKYRTSESWKIVRSQLAEDNYKIMVEIVNMADYGIPQKDRKRMIVAASKDFMPTLPPKRDRISWWDAIADLVPDLPLSELTESQKLAVDEFLDLNDPCPLLLPRVGFRGRCVAIGSSDRAPTLLKSIFIDGRENDRDRFLDLWLPGEETKRITLGAAARLQSFPDWYECTGTGAAIGYAVPPLFAKQFFGDLLDANRSLKRFNATKEAITRIESRVAQRKRKATPSPTCGLSVSFGWTAEYLDKKTVTRRTWKDRHAEKFIRAYHRGDRIIALDKDKRYGGKQVGWLKLSCAPYKEKLANMPENDALAEGGMVETVAEFIEKYFEGDRSLEVWVIRFRFIPLIQPSSPSIPPMKSPLKWAGGKTPLIEKVRSHWRSANCDRWVDLFAGGCSLPLALSPQKCLINDRNPDLISFWRWLQSGAIVTAEFKNEEEYYYQLRSQFNRLRSPEIFYYLNRTGYNGLCRYNGKGEFNTPYGHYKKIQYQSDFLQYKDAIAHWEVTNQSFDAIALQSNDFVFADPPYDDGFVGYSPQGFSWEDQVKLAHKLANHQGVAIATNKATDRILTLYRDLGFQIELIEMPRKISCTGDRQPVQEMFATRGFDCFNP